MTVLDSKSSDRNSNSDITERTFNCRDATLRFFCVDLTGTCQCTPSFRSRDANGREIDIVRSFSPKGVLPKLWKVAVWAVQFLTFAMHENGGGFFFAYATNWALVLATFYSCFSLINSIFSTQQPTSVDSRVGVRVHISWILFLLAANSEMMVTILFWAMLYKGGVPSTFAILAHGVVCVLIWIDGFVVNRIPIRARHWLEICIWYPILYFIWTIIHSSLAANIGNPNKSDSDLIYPFLDWGDGSETPADTIVISILCTFVLSPAVHLIMVGISRCGRRYVNVDSLDAVGGVDIEGGDHVVKSKNADNDPVELEMVVSSATAP
jgi:hypothetical protein